MVQPSLLCVGSAYSFDLKNHQYQFWHLTTYSAEIFRMSSQIWADTPLPDYGKFANRLGINPPRGLGKIFSLSDGKE